MSNNRRVNPLVLTSLGLVTLIMLATESAALLPILIVLMVLLPLTANRRPSVDQARLDAEIRARAHYEHNALMLGHDALGIYGRYQPTPLAALRSELLPPQLQSSDFPPAVPEPTADAGAPDDASAADTPARETTPSDSAAPGDPTPDGAASGSTAPGTRRPITTPAEPDDAGTHWGTRRPVQRAPIHPERTTPIHPVRSAPIHPVRQPETRPAETPIHEQVTERINRDALLPNQPRRSDPPAAESA